MGLKPLDRFCRAARIIDARYKEEEVALPKRQRLASAYMRSRPTEQDIARLEAMNDSAVARARNLLVGPHGAANEAQPSRDPQSAEDRASAAREADPCDTARLNRMRFDTLPLPVTSAAKALRDEVIASIDRDVVSAKFSKVMQKLAEAVFTLTPPVAIREAISLVSLWADADALAHVNNKVHARSERPSHWPLAEDDDFLPLLSWVGVNHILERIDFSDATHSELSRLRAAVERLFEYGPQKTLIQDAGLAAFSPEWGAKIRDIVVGMVPDPQAEFAPPRLKPSSEHADICALFARKPMPAPARREVEKVYHALLDAQSGSTEADKKREWLRIVAEVPYEPPTPATVNVDEVGATLDRTHYGLSKVKRRIVEYAAVMAQRAEQGLPAGKLPPILLDGMPGVGKTSIARSIALATGRKLARVSLGGIGESEIRGHRRTFVEALPGRIVAELRRVGTTHVVLLLDEIDKIGGNQTKGDPAAPLLEVLDPEQNSNFCDHFLDHGLDLSNVLFVATSNDKHAMSRPLLDRMNVIDVPMSSVREKVHIAAQHLVPKQLAEAGLQPDDVAFTLPALREIVLGYTREAGVRRLEERIAEIIRKIVTARQTGQQPASACTKVTPARLPAYLGPAMSRAMNVTDPLDVGVSRGLAYTASGGEVLEIETARAIGVQDTLICTGRLGEVMQESMGLALTRARAEAERLGAKVADINAHAYRVHVPEGAVPKDGPSAGHAVMTALVSLMTGRRVRRDVAMTGEINLRGRVLPVGGIREKVEGAYLAGMRTVLVPRANAGHVAEVDEEVRNTVTIVLVDTAHDVLEAALEPL